jgi:hypothetical protein
VTVHTLALANEILELKATVRDLRADLRAAAVVIDTAYGILDEDGYEAVERAKEGLKAYIVDQIENGGYKQKP